MTLWHGRYPMNFLQIFRAPFPKNTSGGMPLFFSIIRLVYSQDYIVFITQAMFSEIKFWCKRGRVAFRILPNIYDGAFFENSKRLFGKVLNTSLDLIFSGVGVVVIYGIFFALFTWVFTDEYPDFTDEYPDINFSLLLYK